MLTSLDFLNRGEKFPPDSERERLQMYADNKALFEGKHAEIYRQSLERIERVIDDFQNVVSYPIIMNFQKLLSLKIADFLLSEPPIITVSDELESEQKAIDTIVEQSKLFNVAYQVAVDVSRYGDGLFNIYRRDDGKTVIGLTQPPIWFPVVDPNDIQVIIHHVLMWKVSDTKLMVKIHNKGSIEIREYQIEGNIIGRLNSVTTEQTGLSDFAIVQVSNVITSDRCTGFDDYTDIDSIISDLMVRIGQVDKILDKHADPSMSGPQSALEQDPRTGMWSVKSGNYFPRDSTNDPPVEYVTWNGQLDANFQQIERLINLLYSISEMGSALFGESSGNTGQVLTASALKIKMITPLKKVARIRMRFDPALKKAISLCSERDLTLSSLKYEDISIEWFDGLPNDEMQEADIMAKRTGNKATMSVYRALQREGMTDEEADEELARIQEDDSQDAPFSAPPGAEGMNNEGPDESNINIDDLLSKLGG